ncbi:XdhC/CoxI family protein [soil metagenome]
MIVVNHEKGSPGKEGFKMALSSDGEMSGSIGGGIMETGIVDKAKLWLKNKSHVFEIEKLYHRRQVSLKRSGLICSGTQTNVYISITKKDIKLIDSISKIVSSRSKGVLKITEKGIKLLKNNRNPEHFVYDFKNEKSWSYDENIGYKETIFVAGGGHVGLQVCRLFSLLDHYVIVYDDRKYIPTIKANVFADKIILGKYGDFGKYIIEPENTFVVIVTTGYISDLATLMQVAGMNCRYVGLMGTKVKIKKIFNEAVKSGLKKELLKNIYAPIGIDINSNTPEEIAVSIAAEFIRVKNEK